MVMGNKKKAEQKSVREILLMGVFWRILFIEGVLLVYSLGYRWMTADATALDLFWYSVRIIILVVIIIIFMMVTLKKFLTQKIITPLESLHLQTNRFRMIFPLLTRLLFLKILPMRWKPL